MTDFQMVDVTGWEYDLHSVYSAYLGHFQLHNIPWYERSWGHLFESFSAFLAFSWPVVVVSDAVTTRPHAVTRLGSIGAFVKMVKTRFGENLPQVDNILRVRPFETSQRHLRTVSDMTSYRKLHSTFPAVVLNALKVRVRAGDPKAIQELWENKGKTFMSIDFEWAERNPMQLLEFGYAALRCGHLDAVGSWPPVPEANYRKGHYIVQEYVDKIQNRNCPNYPWEYAFGDSQAIPKARLSVIVQAILSSLAGPDSETTANNLVLVGHGLHNDLQRLEDMKIKLPHNILLIDTAVYERTLFACGMRGPMLDAKSNKPRSPNSTLSLDQLLRSLHIDPQCTLHNAGNDAFMTLVALQMMLDPEHTKVPTGRRTTLALTMPPPMPIAGGMPRAYSAGYLNAGTSPSSARPQTAGADYGFGRSASPSGSPMRAPGHGRRRSGLPDEMGRSATYDTVNGMQNMSLGR